MEPGGEWLTVAQARELLGWSKAKMSNAIDRGDIKTEESPHDKRFKLIRRADVEALLLMPRPPKKAVA